MIIHEGVNLTLDNAYLKIFGRFSPSLGDNSNPINIIGNNNSGTIFFNTKEKVIITNTLFKNLTNIRSIYNQPASTTFYECNDVNIINSNFFST